MGRRGYPLEFRREVLDLVEAGRRIAEVAKALGISAQSIYTWRRQDRIDKGLTPGPSSPEKEELAVARRATELLKEPTPLSAVRSHPGDGRRRAAGPSLLPVGVSELTLSRRPLVLVDQSTQDVATTQLRKGRRTRWVTTHRRYGRAQAEAAVQAVLVVVLDVGAQDVNKVRAADDQ